MQTSDIAKIRLQTQQLSPTSQNNIAELVGFMGAMQAQDYAMSKWAIGTRLPHTTDAEVEQALSNGEILRTHILRPTWHLVSAKDMYWMLELSAPQVKKILNSSDKKLGLDEKVYLKATRILEQRLRDHQHLTREALIKAFEEAKINTDDNRPAHLLMRAEFDGLICSGKVIAKKQTYALLEERVKKPKTSIPREEALAKLAARYFTSHGPATLHDFVWWSGLSLTDARKGLEQVKAMFSSAPLGSETYWFSSDYQTTASKNNPLHLLPAYDEYIISYKNRGATLTMEDQKKAFSNNGIFRPVILVDGEGVGLWKRSIKKDEVHIETALFKSHPAVTPSRIKEKAEALGRFLNKKTKLL